MGLNKKKAQGGFGSSHKKERRADSLIHRGSSMQTTNNRMVPSADDEEERGKEMKGVFGLTAGSKETLGPSGGGQGRHEAGRPGTTLWGWMRWVVGILLFLAGLSLRQPSQMPITRVVCVTGDCNNLLLYYMSTALVILCQTADGLGAIVHALFRHVHQVWSGSHSSLHQDEWVVCSEEWKKMKRWGEETGIASIGGMVAACTACRDELGYLRVGRIRVSEDRLGWGTSHNKVVYRGLLDDGRPVAVKRMLMEQYYAEAMRETGLLIQSDGHLNVVRYFCQEMSGDFIYVALQLCALNLEDWMADITKEKAKSDWRMAVGDNGGRGALLGMVEGVAYLHELHIVHKHLQPQNILLAPKKERGEDYVTNEVHVTEKPPIGGDGQKVGGDVITKTWITSSGALKSPDDLKHFTLKISDMGLGNRLHSSSQTNETKGMLMGRQPSSSSSSSRIMMMMMNSGDDGDDDGVMMMNGDGEGGDTDTGSNTGSSWWPSAWQWQAPELLTHRHRNESQCNDAADTRESRASPCEVSRAVDVFSLGCVIFHVASRGGHPFGEEAREQKSNMIQGIPPNLERIAGMPDAEALVAQMISHVPEERPAANEAASHPFFWDELRRLNFLVDFSDRLEVEPPGSPLLTAIEASAPQVVGRSWDKRLDLALVGDAFGRRRYDVTSVRDCLRVLRNKRHHWHDLPVEVHELLKPFPTGLDRYFEERFPHLLMHCFSVTCLLLPHDPSMTATGAGGRHEGGYLGASVHRHRKSFNQRNEKKQQPTATLIALPQCDLERGQEEASSSSLASSSLASRPSIEHAVERRVVEEEEEVEDTPPGSSCLDDVVIWSRSSLAEAHHCRGWWRPHDHWVRGVDLATANTVTIVGGQQQPQCLPPALERCAKDLKYRSRLCNHWDKSKGMVCPMRKKGRCDFAHGPLELRVREDKRHRWGRVIDEGKEGDSNHGDTSGGENTYGAARHIERMRSDSGRNAADTSHTDRHHRSSGSGGHGYHRNHPHRQTRGGHGKTRNAQKDAL